MAADYVLSSARDKLNHPTDAPDEETDVDEEQDEGWIPASVLPVHNKRQLLK